MKSMPLFAGLALAGIFTDVVTREATSLPAVTVKGNALYANGARFYIRGVAYQPGGSADAADPLIDIPALTRDIKNFKTLGINTIRVYTVDNSADHTEGMNLLAAAGIYLALDVNTPQFSLNRANPFLSYNEKYLQSVFATVDAFAKFTNTLLFFSGNEVINDKATTGTAPFVRAVTRDIKNYINARGHRRILTGYSSADVAENVALQLQYFSCGDQSSAVDVYAFNDYSYCSPSDFVTSGWAGKVARYTGSNVPLFLSEFGCITNKRDWSEITYLYSPNMTSVFSGGVAYEYAAGVNGYGIVDISNGLVTPNQDFQKLAKAFAATPNPPGDGGANFNTTPPACPSSSSDWAPVDLLIPAPPAGIQPYMKNGAGKGPGLSDKGVTSQSGGETYSESNVTMSGVVVKSTNNASTSSDSSSSSGSSGSSGGGSSKSTSGAAGQIVPTLLLSIPIVVGYVCA